MSRTKTIQTQTLAGFMEGRQWIGHADEARTYAGAVPREDALALLSYPLAEGKVTVSLPIITDDGVETLTIDAPDRKAVVRTDTATIMGMFMSGYQIHQPAKWCLDNLDLILDGGLEIGTVAVVKGGKLAMLQAELPESRIATAPGAEPVAHRPQITAATSHDGSTSTLYGVGDRVLICENQISVSGLSAFGFDAVTKIRHSSRSLSRVFEVRANLGLVVEEIGDAFDEQFRILCAQHVTDARFEEIVQAFTGEAKAPEGRSKTIATNKANALRDLWRDDPRAAPWKNSAYGVLATFNTAQNHILGADKGRTERNQQRTIEGKWETFDAGILRLLQTA